MSVDVGVEMEWDPQKSWIWGVPIYQSGALTTLIVQNEAYTSLDRSLLTRSPYSQDALNTALSSKMQDMM